MMKKRKEQENEDEYYCNKYHVMNEMKHNDNDYKEKRNVYDV